MSLEGDPSKSAGERFAADLVRLRSENRLSQIRLATRLQVDRSLISHIERGKKTPTVDIAERLDDIFGLDKHFVGVFERIRLERGARGWIIQWREVESRALVIQSWDPLLVPGLFQTMTYARALFQASPTIPAELVDIEVQTRIQRSDILSRKDPPKIIALLEEAVLHRPIGGGDILCDQLIHLRAVAQLPNVVVQVVPTQAGCGPGLMSAFALARLPNGADVITVDSSLAGQTTMEPRSVEEIKQRFDVIRADALPKGQSLTVIEEAIERWTSRQ
ncbi:helix-turn-helix domain-containing protein [Nonomuraea harbinensis]|uniref:Scr1 family TA system antitoxin-like transcriptional regulator n=1 Tax=Nonomuraea harbinensis TaxID=1286938 RepID=A0ABW1BPL5_9ACTN|nr:helix-turn-helix transcriptional regulator [Nonomuraea harbinensis]